MRVSLFTDASYCSRTKAAGWAAWAKCQTGKVSLAKQMKHPCGSSVQAEAAAIANGLRMIRNSFPNATHVLIQTDCLSVIKSYPVHKNPDIQEVYKVIVEHEEHLRLEWRHIKAHSGTGVSRKWVNDWCDRQAGKQMRKMRTRLHKERRS